ncbi:hypothetical protein ElyMa_001660100 [Elysia marginata]|uniref:Uncharacterized protein n=1 Tax=Elysia marginata TaxID=1093978 RepID=A0AAV4JNG7_9GAST|nr:hypothetical protein ElyMa_001660100 [Elysia marginata]
MSSRPTEPIYFLSGYGDIASAVTNISSTWKSSSTACEDFAHANFLKILLVRHLVPPKVTRGKIDVSRFERASYCKSAERTWYSIFRKNSTPDVFTRQQALDLV